MPKTHFLPGSPRSLEPFSPSTGPRPSACTKTTSPSVQRGPCTVPPAHVGIRRGRAARSTRALTSTCQRDWRLRRSEFLGPHRFQSGGGSCGPAIQFEGAALCKFARPLGRAVSCSLFPLGLRLRVPDGQGDHLALSCDVAKEHDVQNTFEEIEKNLGRVNFLVNAAGINRDNLLVRTNAEEMLSQLHTNLLGSMLTCRAAVKTMIKQQSGSIVNVGSVVGLKGNSGQSVYSASKGGLVGFSRALAKEVAKKKIRVNVVAPGFIHTDMTKDLNEEHLKKNIPLGRFGDALDVAQAVVFLLESPYVTGHVLVVDGGLQLTM